MFIDLKKQIQSNFDKLAKQQLFIVNIDKDEIWNRYINAFEETYRQENQCRCCMQFLRQWGGIVIVKDNKLVSLWDNITVTDEYAKPVAALKRYIHSLPISNVFLESFAKVGTDKTPDRARNVTWNHFFLELPREYVNSRNIDTVRGEKRTNFETLKRALTELRKFDTETVLELIGQGSLYRGAEHKSILEELLKVQKEFAEVPEELQDNYIWQKSSATFQALTRIRNSAIGTLLVNLSGEMPLDEAVEKYEKVVAPLNYKRPNSITTPKMREEARKTLESLGYIESLERRLAVETDLDINDLLFTDKSYSSKDIFAELDKNQVVNPKTLKKTEEVTIEEFLENIVPNAKTIEVLIENRHQNNFVSLVTAKDNNAPTMFKWNNPFSWSYTGGVTDSIKENVKNAGGNVEGVLRFSIQWNKDGISICDLDAHAFEPDGTEIYWSSFKLPSKTRMTGNLDVDMIRPSSVGVENITWLDKSKMKAGIYTFGIKNYDGRYNQGFEAQVEFDGEVHDFSYSGNFAGFLKLAKVTLDKNGNFSIENLMESTSKVFSKEKWGLKTNTFAKVKKVMLSPNYWGENATGNKHYIFALDGCVSDEKSFPFFNEFLSQDLNKHRKTMEILSQKIDVDKTPYQVSGLGFSSTIKNSLIVKVTGAFTRTLKVNF